MHKMIASLARDLRAIKREHEDLADRIDDLKSRLEDAASNEKSENDDQDETEERPAKRRGASAPKKRDFFDGL